MSLLDDVSIVVTPNGYKAGELYAVIPVPTEGAEEITNGSFANDLDDWSKYGVTSATGGIATIGASANSGIYQTILTQGVRYTVTINVVSVNATGTSEVTNGNGNNLYTITETGIQTFTFISAIASGQIILRGMSNALFSVSSVSVKEYTSADMDVTRNTAATRVDENGLVNYAEIVSDTELVTNGDFATDSDWTKGTGWTISEGNLNASNVNAASTTQSGYTFVGKTFQVSYTISDYSQGSVQIYLGGSQSTSLKSANGTHTETISISSGNTLLYIYGTSNFTGNIDNVSVKEVTRNNVPRIDYTGGGCPHILSEPMRTNLIPYSEDLTDAFYLTTGIGTVTESTTLSPDGTGFGYTITPTSSATNHYFNYSWGQLTVAIGDEVTYSIFVKPNGYSFIQIASSSGFPAKYQNFELTGDGVIGTGDIGGKTIEKIGDWYRCSVTETASGVNPRFLLSPSETALATRNPVYSGNATDGVLGWGVQVEVGSYATSYIPNFGTAAGVTRNQDIFTRDGIGSLINSTEGVLFVEMAALSDDSTDRVMSLSDGTNNHRILLAYTSTTNQIQAFHNDNVSPVNLVFTVSDVTDFHKVAFKYKVNDFALWVDGVEVATNNTKGVNMANTLNELKFENASGSSDFFGKVKQLQVYTTALTDTQLAALTS